MKRPDKICSFEREIVPYIYRELGDSDYKRFEEHLADCSTCTDELAAVSYSRYSVYEYKREAFDHLATPLIHIPYSAAPSRLAVAWRSWRFVFAGSLATAAAAMLVYFNAGPNVPVVQPNTSAVVASKTQADVVSDIQVPDEPATSIGKTPVTLPSRTVRRARPLTPSPLRRTDIRQKRTAPTNLKPVFAIRSAPAVTPAQAPVLSNFEDTDDRSLRLTDLFDTEVGIR